MNKSYPCDIIKDLLPGYTDGVLSETSTQAVRAHLEACEECRQTAAAMKECLDSEEFPKEQLALDGFKKVRQHTRKLKLTLGLVCGLLLLLLAGFFGRFYLFGAPLPTHAIHPQEVTYDEATESLTIKGNLNTAFTRISRITYEESKENPNDVNILIYGAETLPFWKGSQNFSITIPNMKGKTAYLACPDYDQLKIYSWSHAHYDLVAELEEEIYSRIPGLDKKKDILTPYEGIDTVDEMDGMRYSVETAASEDAAFWWMNGQLFTYGEFENQSFDIWISLEKPYEIRFLDYQTGDYTEELPALSK